MAALRNISESNLAGTQSQKPGAEPLLRHGHCLLKRLWPCMDGLPCMGRTQALPTHTKGSSLACYINCMHNTLQAAKQHCCHGMVTVVQHHVFLIRTTWGATSKVTSKPSCLAQHMLLQDVLSTQPSHKMPMHASFNTHQKHYHLLLLTWLPNRGLHMT